MRVVERPADAGLLADPTALRLRGNPLDFDVSILGIYDLCLMDATTIRWDEGISEVLPDYGT